MENFHFSNLPIFIALVKLDQTWKISVSLFWSGLGSINSKTILAPDIKLSFDRLVKGSLKLSKKGTLSGLPSHPNPIPLRTLFPVFWGCILT